MLNIFKLTSFLSSAVLISTASLNVSQKGMANDFATEFQRHIAPFDQLYSEKKEPKLTLKEVEEQAKKINDNLENPEFQNTKIYQRGTNEFKWTNGLVGEVWITKAYLGNAATILGVAGAAAALIAAMAALIIAASGPFAGLIAAIIGVGYAVSVATFMNKINGYEVGGYFKFDKTGVFSWATILGTLREQNKYETAKRLVKQPDDHNFAIKRDSHNFLLEDYSKGYMQQYWTVGKNVDHYVGVIDITKHTAHLEKHAVDYIRGSIGLLDQKDGTLKVDFNNSNSRLTFLKDYFSRKFDYLFLVINKTSKGYEMKMGGDEVRENKSTIKHWLTVSDNLTNPITNIALELEIYLKEVK